MRRYAIALLLFLALAAKAADTTKPWTFWYWMYGAVSKSGIQADLKAMKEVGLGGCYLMPIKSADDWRGDDQLPDAREQMTAWQLSDDFWEMVDYAFYEADSLGLDLGIHICDGFALAGGPWIEPEESMLKVVWTETDAVVDHSGQTISLPQPETNHGFYQDIGAWAVTSFEPVGEPVYGGTIQRGANGVFVSKEPGYIDLVYSEPQTVRSIFVEPSGNNIQAQRLLVQASNDGASFTTVRQLVPPRQGWQNTDQGYTFSLPETTAKVFRLCWTPEGTEPGGEDMDAAKWAPTLKLKNVRLQADPKVNLFEAKNGSVWRIDQTDGYPSDIDGYDICRYPIPLMADGMADLAVPTGRWKVYRFGYTTTGHTNATGGGGKGLECSKFSPKAVRKQLSEWFGRFMQRPNHHVVKVMHVDSWECGSQNWSIDFDEEFAKRRGYNFMVDMPVYAGVPIENAPKTLYDIRQTIAEMVSDVFFETVADVARSYGVKVSSESVAPTMVSDGMLHYSKTDVPMGEFWLNSPTHDKPNDMLDAISAAHVYGKNIIQAEGFTEVRGVWNETPAMLKTLLDRQFALGMNRLVFHVFTHNPFTTLRPGMTLDGIGLFFQPSQTWFADAKGMVDYITRCQEVLQKGNPVTDIAVFTGEEVPRRSLLPDRLVTMLPGLFGKERGASEQKRLANEGNPMEESPVGVRHSAGIVDMKDWINPLHGYQYDSMNKDALLNLPFAYKVLVVPNSDALSPEVEKKITALRTKGVVVITQPYREPQLPDLLPDAVLPEGIAFTHRKDDTRHYYFLSNQTDSTKLFTAYFRVRGMQPVLYDPLTGQRHLAHATYTESQTGADIVLDKHASVVVELYDEAQPLSYMPETTTEPIGEKQKWSVTFTGNGEQVAASQLFDWSESTSDKIRYYSGTARYATTFKLKKSADQYLALQLPGLHDVARVRLNGKELGIVWTEPYTVLLGDALRKGVNKLEIDVTNTWHNALRGAAIGKPPYDNIWTNARYRMKEDALLPAGLLNTPQLIIKK